MEIEINVIHMENCIQGLKKLPDNSVDCCVTSPPYFGLRDYGTHEQVGLESSPEEYVAILVEIFEQVRRILKAEGTLWLNLGDSYWGGKGKSGSQSPQKAQDRKKEGIALTSENQQLGGKGYTRPTDLKHNIIKSKDLIGIPWMVAFALRGAGWYLRQDIIWAKPNPMPESVIDRCTKSHEYIFLFSKSPKYYFDSNAIRTPLAKASDRRLAQNIQDQKGSDRVPGKTNGPMKAAGGKARIFGGKKYQDMIFEPGDPQYRSGSEQWTREYTPSKDGTANKKSVWNVAVTPFKEAHFATFPEKIPTLCIKAGCPLDGIVLDPFLGSGTTAMVANKLGRNYIGFESNPKYVALAEKRLTETLKLFKWPRKIIEVK